METAPVLAYFVSFHLNLNSSLPGAVKARMHKGAESIAIMETRAKDDQKADAT